MPRSGGDSTTSSKEGGRGLKFWQKNKHTSEGAATSLKSSGSPPSSKLAPTAETTMKREINAQKQLSPSSQSDTISSKKVTKPRKTTRTQPPPTGIGGYLARTSAFKAMVNWAFEAVDTDKSGAVDESELYTGLLLIHLKLGMYAGPAACRSLAREKCTAVFRKFDHDDSHTLDRDEFSQAMLLLFSNVLLRVLTLWTATIVLVPLVSKSILDGIYWTSAATWDFISDLDEHSFIASSIELAMESARDGLVDMMPNAVVRTGSSVGRVLAYVPESVWITLPLTLVSTVLSMLAIPWLLIKIDDFFQAVADARATRKERRMSKIKTG